MGCLQKKFGFLFGLLTLSLAACAEQPGVGPGHSGTSNVTSKVTGEQQPVKQQPIAQPAIGLEGISSLHTTYLREAVDHEMLPRGAALLTQSGNLAKQNITHIIHAASGAMGPVGDWSQPSVDGVKHSIINSFVLAERFGHKRVALPFIGGRIFLGALGMTKKELARAIVQTALENRKHLEVRMVAYGTEDFDIFNSVLAESSSQPPYQDLGNAFLVVEGDIAQFAVHGATVIVNAANMEVTFGGGVSGKIGSATGIPTQINNEAHALIRQFNRKVLQELGESS
jgi:O-acetyl-ADP-ribose deacetylase (regulator of RNase III)